MFLICLLCCAYISIPSQRYSRVVDWIWNHCSLNVLDSQIHIMLLETQRRLPIVSLANHIAICLYGHVLSSTTLQSLQSPMPFSVWISKVVFILLPPLISCGCTSCWLIYQDGTELQLCNCRVRKGIQQAQSNPISI